MSVRLRAKGAGEERSENGSSHDTPVTNEGDLRVKHSDRRRESGYCCWWYAYVSTYCKHLHGGTCNKVLVHIMCASGHGRTWIDIVIEREISLTFHTFGTEISD